MIKFTNRHHPDCLVGGLQGIHYSLCSHGELLQVVWNKISKDRKWIIKYLSS